LARFKSYYYWQSDITGFEKLTNDDLRNEIDLNESTESIFERKYIGKFARKHYEIFFSD
jgi:hypothetical protein